MSPLVPPIIAPTKIPAAATQQKLTSGTGGKPAAAVLAAQTKAARAKSPSPQSIETAVVRTPSPKETTNGEGDLVTVKTSQTGGLPDVSSTVTDEDYNDIQPVSTLKRSNTFTFSEDVEETEEKA